MASNLPPKDANPLADRLAEQHAALLERTDQLVAALARVPAVVDETTIDRAAGYVKQLREHAKAVEAIRVAEKEPYLANSRTIDAFFKAALDRLTNASTEVERRLKAYMAAKVAAERLRREQEAKAAREEADRLQAAAEAAAAAVEEDSMAAALALEQTARLQEQTAREAEAAAQARTADLARTRGALGGTATLMTSIAFEVLDHNAAVAALRHLIDDEALARALRTFAKDYKGSNGHALLLRTQPVAGVRFYLREVARVV